MTSIAKLYLKTFLLTGIPFGLIFLGFEFAIGDELKLWKFLFTTLLFGTIMSLIIVSFHRNSLKKNDIDNLTTDNLSLSQTKNITSRLNKNELIRKLQKDPIFGKMTMMEIEDGIVLKTGMTWKSWGEDIKIILTPHGDPDFDYKVISSPRIKTTIVDYGKNIDNVNRIENILKISE